MEWTPNQVNQLYNIEVACFPRGRRWSKRDFKYHLRKSDTFVQRSLTPPYLVGLLVGWRRGRTGYIGSLAVLSQYRGHGVGQRLLEEAEVFYREKCTSLLLNVRIDNPAQKMYFDCGFRVYQLRKGILSMRKLI